MMSTKIKYSNFRWVFQPSDGRMYVQIYMYVLNVFFPSTLWDVSSGDLNLSKQNSWIICDLQSA